ncbi:FAR1 DNA binding domain, Zinc finger, SWIM-type, MULE transposase domain, FHY3/FAR1 family [Artemisia annua]|uniref:FAR1 DNA binding domain, Zinc finger, SWIM-type, MULE transposase domain, FHY3/FAR1 family n=1 Tax=Artemisia annua TaxID=35608 RepID=A0A2U1N4B1_ARTAN|nr:FAR1 DNA binding domain, Zinc finger, SWIM-type, MULE transposase domain, FHY3/FAR1 family [Artemisia annua]
MGKAVCRPKRVVGEPLIPRAVNNDPRDVFGDSLFTPADGEPLTPRAVNSEPLDPFVDYLFTPPHDHQVGIFQPTPNGTKYWVPKVINKPVEGQVFDTLELALNAYKEYAREGGFEVRKGGQKYTKDSKDEPNNKYFYCVRQGFKPPPNAENQKAHKQQPTNPLGVTKVIKRRKRASCRCGCTAQLRLKKIPDGRYTVSKFIEKHNHSLVYEEDIKYLRASRRLTFSKQQLLNQLSNVNIGPVRSWKLFNPHLSLIEFLSHFDTAMDAQRFKYGKNTHDSKYTTPDFKTHLQVEKEAAELYTQTVFYDVQDEIFESLFHCCSLSVQEDGTSLTYLIRDTEADYTTIHGVTVEAKYEVKYVAATCDIKCTCLKYECYGLLCRHIFYVLRLSKVFHFPRKYLQQRWSKYAMPNKSVTRPVDVASLSNAVECVNGVVREIYGTVEDSVTRLVTDIQKLHIYKNDLDTLLEQVKIDIPNAPEMSKKELYAAALGVKEPEVVNIVAPECRNKGSVSLKRHQTQAEIAMIQSNKPPRHCNYCDTYGYHDSRNCPKKKADLDEQMD